MAEIEWTGVKELKVSLDQAKALLVGRLDKALDTGADELVALQKAACPVLEAEHDFGAEPGRLRNSIRKEPGRTRFARVVVADAKDDKGKEYGLHVELGHRSRSGQHVPAYAFFFPAWRIMKKRIRARISRARSQFVKDVSA